MNDNTRRSVIRFGATGSEYFRIWAVNLLLVAVTLGFYLPFAKARRLRYFYANTWVDGHALAFHGDPWRMFRGYLLNLLIFGAYAAANWVSEWATLAAFVLLGLLWPALWRSSLQFRLGNTSWRGLRFGFDGTLAGAYWAMLPAFVPSAAILALSAWAMNGIDPGDEQAVQQASASMLPGMLAFLAAALAVLPGLLWMIKRYQHGGYRYAGQQARFEAGLGRFYGFGLKGVGLALLMVVVVGALAAGGAVVVGLLAGRGETPAVGGVLAGLAGGILAVLAYLVLLTLVQAYFGAQMQNISWNATHSPQLRFSSALGVRALAGLTLKNLILVVVSLGLYRPFAAVEAARLRLESVTVEFEGDVEQWLAGAAGRAGGGSGEMAGDFFGIDVGL